MLSMYLMFITLPPHCNPDYLASTVYLEKDLCDLSQIQDVTRLVQL